jgi:hypothetical protein
MQPHYHKWENKGGISRGPETKGKGKNSRTISYPLTKGMMKLFHKIKKYAI